LSLFIPLALRNQTNLRKKKRKSENASSSPQDVVVVASSDSTTAISKKTSKPERVKTMVDMYLQNDDNQEAMVKTMMSMVASTSTSTSTASVAEAEDLAFFRPSESADASRPSLSSHPETSQSLIPLLNDPGLAIDASLFLLYNSVFHENRHNEDVATVFNIISQMLVAMKKYFQGGTAR